jgi:Metallo-peptidase family M12B Reprolysin-like/Secretion system C-terminal sorting domain/Fibronectin type III domain
LKKLFASCPPRWLRTFAACGLLLPALAYAQTSGRSATELLQDDPAPTATPLAAALRHARPLTLAVASAQRLLASAPAEGSGSTLTITLPLPDGRTERFAITTTAVMAPALATRFPSIQTYAGVGLDDATATVRLDLTPAGFHAQILSGTTGTVYIDPARRGDTQHYLSFFKRDMLAGGAVRQSCAFVPTKADLSAAASRRAAQALPGAPAEISSGGALRTYRLAVSATGEYTRFFGGTVPLAQAAIVTSVNRVVGVYEKELAVRLVLVPGNDALVYTNAATDPFTNNDGGALLDENQVVIDSTIGSANYDIGHVFSTGGGGVAFYACVCKSGIKAKGVTGSGSPVGDSFDIDYVAHEMGHQFSGSHPFNSESGACNGNRSADAAWEPGSGTTIMAYAGICDTDDLQPHSDAQFHVGNFEEMRGFIITTPCAVLTPTNNTAPVVTGPASGKTLPMETPFKLTANAHDADGDALTYSWEELDLGPGGSPNDPQVPDETPPLFRSFVPSASPTRYFPRLADLVTNTTDIGEHLPTVDRTLKFKCTARDEHRGPAGVIGGVTSSDDVDLSVTSAAGPFLVTAPNTTISWVGGSTESVTWNIAGTTGNGVNCALVNVRLSTDGGFTYPTVLAANVPNNGSASITVPNVATTTARVMVEAADNYFFDISNTNFAIGSASICAPPTALVIDNLTTTTARLSFAPSASAVSYTISTVPATTTQTVTASPVSLTGLTPGTIYTVSIVSSCGAGSTSGAATATFTTPAMPECSTPTEIAVWPLTSTSATINFVGSVSAIDYTVTTIPATTTQTVTSGPVTLNGLQPATPYIVRIVGNCGAIGTSTVGSLSFTTPALPPPVNDQCGAALPLSCGTTVSGTTVGATTTGDPFASCGVNIDRGGVFYTLTGNGGMVTVSTCDGATDFDTKLFVYTGTCGGPYTCVGGNDDTDTGACNLPSTVTFQSTLNANYFVFVSGYDQEEGNFGLTATCTPPTGLSAATEATAFVVWPNPVGNAAALHLTLAVAAPTAPTTATLFNVLGQQVTRHAFNGSTTDLATTGLAAGTYWLTVQAGNQAPVVRRVVIE